MKNAVKCFQVLTYSVETLRKHSPFLLTKKSFSFLTYYNVVINALEKYSLSIFPSQNATKLHSYSRLCSDLFLSFNLKARVNSMPISKPLMEKSQTKSADKASLEISTRKSSIQLKIIEISFMKAQIT